MVERYRDMDADGRHDAVREGPYERPVGPYDRSAATYERPVAGPVERPVARREVVEEGPVETGGFRIWPPTFSVGATFLGWCVASFLTFVLLALVGAAMAPSLASDVADGGGITFNEAQDLGTVGAIGALLAVFVAYLVGGYAAGRISIWKGVLHGALVPVWTLLVALLAWAVGAAIAGQADLGLTPGVELSDITGAALLALVVTLAVMFAGAALGGAWGERIDADDVDGVTRRRATYRGRAY